MSAVLPAKSFSISPAGVAIAIALLAPFLIYFETMKSIVSIWNSSETFAHGYIILPISLWLIWQRRHVLAALPPTPFWPALLLLAACGFGWLLAELGAVQVVQQYTVVAMLPIIALALLGLRLTMLIAFPLLFLLLAVPFGEVFIDPLILLTADFTVAALRASGIPVYREGTNFIIPSGSWSVVTACSGVRYLIASFTLGCLYAYLTYRSRRRQLLFVALAIVVPILANWIRAYMIVMIGHLSGNELATGVDHLIYGWLFFGLVMLLMFWIGSFWREDLGEPPASSATLQATAPTPVRLPTASGSPAGVMLAASAVIACLVMWPAYSGYITRASHNTEVANFQGFTSRWEETQPFTTWRPNYFPAHAEFSTTRRSGERQVGLNVLYYRNQDRGSMLISSTNRIVAEDDKAWRRTGSGGLRESVNGIHIPLRETRIDGPGGRAVVWTWYWIDGRFLASDYVGKLLQAKTRLLMEGDDGAAIHLVAPYQDNAEDARGAMRAFLQDNLAAIETTLNANRKAQPAAIPLEKQAHAGAR